MAATKDAIRVLPRFTLEPGDAGTDTLCAEVKTALGGFTDEVTVRVRPAGPGGKHSRVTVRSRSRVGRGDLGENARHIRALQRAMDARLPR